MCGIFSIINHTRVSYEKEEYIKNNFMKGKERGPEYSKIQNREEMYNNILLGFHRLAINGLDEESHQPIEIDNYSLICNGEIYNYKELFKTMNITPKTKSDCEVIIHLVKRYGIEETLDLLDGVFAFVLLDKNSNKIHIARDIYGVRPLFMGFADETKETCCFASEIKMLNGFCHEITPFLPGTYSEIIYSIDENYSWWDYTIKNRHYNSGYITSSYCLTGKNKDEFFKESCETIKNSLIQAVKKRVENTDRPIACLLSGGLDSSLITSLVNYIKKDSYNKLETYSIGFKGSQDLKYARIVADYLDTKHHEIIVEEKDFLDAIPKVIKVIESYDTTTVRASVGNYLVSKYIKEHSDAKVIFNGDGSDEITGGYLYFHEAPDNIAFDKECKRLLKDIHLYDVLRSDRSIASNGLEARTPFLDKTFVANYLSIPLELRNHRINGKCEKYLLREAFKDFLPDEVLYRTKEAFSDGVSKQTRSWYEIIQEHVEKQNVDTSKIYNHNQPTTKEQYYYRELFEKYYNGCEKVIPYFWMPRFVEATDSSARTLNIYKKSNTNINGVL